MTGNSRHTIHALFREQARLSPDATALLDGERRITYGELDDLSTRVAGRLTELGIRAGDPIGLHMDRSISWVITTLGVLKANAAVVPLPPAFPAGRLKDVVAHACLKQIIDAPESRLAIDCERDSLCVESMLSADPPPLQLLDPASGNPAFVLCSSGSTGLPKLIVRSHESFMHRLNWTWDHHPYQEDEVCCQKAQVTTTHSIYELFEPLLRGTPVVIIPEDTVRDLEAFWKCLSDHGVSRLLIVPSALHATLQIPDFSPPPIKVMVLMGEYVDAKLAERALSEFASSYIYSMYGSTEASSIMVCNLRESWREGEELPLGDPISKSIKARVLDPNLLSVPPGEAGQLYVSGPPLFTEYLNDPQLTDSVVTRSPGQPERLYNTCDRVRLMPDGRLQFVGRVDDTVKIRGFRVDLKEVENALLELKPVNQAAVLVDNQRDGAISLLAFVTPSDIDSLTAFAALRAQLPDYMIPSTIVCLDEFPTTERGKLDKDELLAKHRDRRPLLLDLKGLSETERIVYGAWSEILGHHSFDLDSSFFEVGGTSLTVYSLVQKLRSEFAFENDTLSAQTLYRFPTIGLLARRIERIAASDLREDDGDSSLLVPLKQSRNSSLAPLFLIASAGGTVGAYEKLVGALDIERDIIGIRDPFVWGARDPCESFQLWVERYIDAIRSRQAHGPYLIGAYSSAGCFGLEVARRLRDAGEEVERLILIDPLALDRRDRSRFGWWALRATYSGRLLRLIVRVAGWFRLILPRNKAASEPHTFSLNEYQQVRRAQLSSKSHLMLFASLLELNTGLPFSLSESDFSEKQPEQYIDALKSRFSKLMPQVDEIILENMVVQYELQVRTQHAYRIQHYEGRTELFEPASRYAGLVASLLKPYLPQLRTHTIAVGSPRPESQGAALRFGALDPHYRCMREDEFVRRLGEELDQLV